MNTLKLVIIDSNYCDYLRGFDSKVAYNYAKKDTRPFIGVLFNVGNMEYFAHTRDDGGKRFWKKYTTRRNVCSAIWSPAKGKGHIVTATL